MFLKGNTDLNLTPEDSYFTKINRFDAAAAELASRNHPNYRLCCQPNCDAGQVHFGRERQMVCHTCNGSSCVFHGVPWHEGMSCNEYEITVNGNERSKKRRAQDEAKSERWVLNNTRLCTNLQCKAPIQKWQGCDQMHCQYFYTILTFDCCF